MAFYITCPDCATQLKSANAVAIGTMIKCPKCKTAFLTDHPAIPYSEAAASPPAPPPAPPPTAPAPEPSELPLPGLRVERTEEDDLPEAQIVDHRPLPRRRRTDDDVDDRPRGRRRRDEDDDDEEERPRRRRADGDEDDDREAVWQRSRRDDDLELDDERPKRRKKKGRKQGVPVALIGGGVAAFLLLLFVGLYFINPFNMFGGGGGPPNDMLAWAPAETQAIRFLNFEELRNVADNREDAAIPFRSRLAIDMKDVKRVMTAHTNRATAGRPAGGGGIGGVGGGFGGFDGFGGGDADVVVIQTKSAISAERVLGSAKGKEVEFGGRKYYRWDGGGAHFPNDRTLVIFKAETDIQEAIVNGGNAVKISNELKSAIQSSNGIMVQAAVGTMARQFDMIGALADFAGFAKGQANAANRTVTRTVLTMNVSGRRGRLQVESTYDSVDTAKQVAESWRSMMKEAGAKASGDGESADISQSGATVTLKITGPIDKGSKRGGFFP